MNDKHENAFVQEAYELLAKLEDSLMELENDPDDKNLISEIFRSLHTIKGGGGMFGFDAIAEFVHEIETIFDKIRDDELKVTNEIIDLTLKAGDQIKLMLEDEDSVQKEIVETLVISFKKILGNESKPVKNINVEETEINYAGDDEKSVFHIRFTPPENLFVSGTNPLGLLNEITDLGECIVIPDTEKLPDFDSYDPEKLYVSWDIILSTDRGLNAVKDVFIFVEDESVIDIKKIDTGNLKGDAAYYSALLLKDETGKNDTKTSSDENVSRQKNKEKNSKPNKQGLSNIRVSSDKLDFLVNLVGELVTTQARVSQIASTGSNPDFIDVAEDLERLIWELRENVLSIRMLPIGTTFSKFKRLVRDLSKGLNKKVELITDGGETELDKNVIEKLDDPLVHIIRNSIDHGLGTPDERKENGKDETGSVFLSAIHSGTHVFVKIKDDGKGLDKDKIYNKAVENGLIQPGTELTDYEIYNLIFQPGFSTASSVTNVSGRGVGMDVVKNAITALRGTVEVESEKGAGTTITLKLPLTLAIIEGLVVRVDKDHFVVPLSHVEECIEFISGKDKNTNGRKLLNVRGEVVPYVSLRERFEITGNKPAIEQIVVINENDKKIGLVVDEIIDKHQTVIKSLGKFYKNIEAMSGATVMGDGTVALIIDVPKLISDEIKEETQRVTN